MIRLALIFTLLASQLGALTLSSDFGDTEITIKGRKVTVEDYNGETKIYWDNFGTYDKDTNTRTIRSHSGGNGYVAIALVVQARERGEKVKMLCDQFNFWALTTGCTSSATFFLGAENVCVGQRADLNFHGPSPKVDNRTLSLIAKYTYPKEIHDIFVTKWGQRIGFNFYKVKSRELKQLIPKLEYCK
jgi:hypothetical protein